MDSAKRVAIYARVSTDLQTIDAQVSDLIQYCQRKQWQAPEKFIDEGVSGAALHRTNLDRMMTLVRQGRFDVVLVWKYDRYARTLVQLVMALDELKSLNVDFVSVMDNIDTTTPIGRFMFQINAGYAELERANIKQRAAMGIRYALEKGVKFGRRGWKTRDGVISPEKINLIRSLAGQPHRLIAKRTGVGKGTVYRVLKSAPRKVGANVAFSLVEPNVAF